MAAFKPSEAYLSAAVEAFRSPLKPFPPSQSSAGKSIFICPQRQTAIYYHHGPPQVHRPFTVFSCFITPPAPPLFLLFSFFLQTEAAGQDVAAQGRPRERDAAAPTAAAPTAAQKQTAGTRDERGKDTLRTAGTKSSARAPRGQSGKTEEKNKRTHPNAKLRPAQHMVSQTGFGIC